AAKPGTRANLLRAVLHSPGPTFGVLNTLGLSDPELDRLIESAEAAPSATHRARLLRTAQLRATRLRAALPLVVQTEAVVHARRIAWDPPLNMVLRAEDLAPVR
ncbi:MAG TPA: hypothetical protein VFM88_15585, partial [Vicinamibacteria bacterium]|nr:hypothetical protein [Vicinamibacteria bacterium]